MFDSDKIIILCFMMKTESSGGIDQAIPNLSAHNNLFISHIFFQIIFGRFEGKLNLVYGNMHP